MLESLFEHYLPFFIHLLELMGIVVIVVGALKAFYYYLLSFFTAKEYEIKHQFANAMATALEFKLGAEILKTVIVRSLHELAILGAIVLLRIIMTIIIQWEIKQSNNSQKEVTK